MWSGLSPECKQLLLAGCVGYLLSIWQVLCVAVPLPLPDGIQSRPDLADLTAKALTPQTACRQIQDLFAARIKPPRGEIRMSVQRHVVRRNVDPDARHPDDPATLAKRATASLRAKSKAVQRPTPVYTVASLIPTVNQGRRSPFVAPPGRLSARFESGAEGVFSVGHTSSAGTSYGTYQIASATPTYANFLRFLQTRAPEIHARLTAKGPANTGSAVGAVPEEWRRIARENPVRFDRLQYEFILQSHYRPAVEEIYEETGLDVCALSPAIREVLWSAVVQHGLSGGTGIFVNAVNAIKPRVLEERRTVLLEQALIEEVYAYRLRAMGAKPLRGAMLQRYGKEKSQALFLVERHYSGG